MVNSDVLVASNAEPQVIGAIVQEWRLINDCRNRISEEHFGDILCAAAFRTMLKLSRNSSGKFTLKSVIAALPSEPEFKLKTPEEVIEFMTGCTIDADPALLEFYIQNVVAQYTRRQLDMAADRIKASARNHLVSITEVVEKSQSEILAISAGRREDAESDQDYKNDLMAKYDNPRLVRGFQSGFQMLDVLTGGLMAEKHHMNLFFGHSHVGKSYLIYQILFALCDEALNNLNGRKIGVAPTEMPPNAVKNRLIAFKMGISPKTLQTGRFKDVYKFKDKSDEYIRKLLSDTIDWVNSLPIEWIWYRDRLVNGRDILNHGMTGKYPVMIVDGLKNLGMDPTKNKTLDNVYSLIHSNCEYLHETALNTETPIFVTHQMKTMQAGRKDKRPMQQDLFGGMDVYEFATFSAAIYRPAQHQFTDGANDRRLTDEERRRLLLYINKDRYGGAEGKTIELSIRNDGGVGFKELGVKNRD